MSELDQYVESVARSLRGSDPDGLDAGQYEGLLATGRARLQPGDGETEKHHSGYLLGHVLRWMHERGRAIDNSITPFTLYGSAVAHAQAQRMLVKDGVFGGHVYAAMTTERRTAQALPPEDERMLFGWLCEQDDVTVTPAMVKRLEDLRTRRHARSGLQG